MERETWIIVNRCLPELRVGEYIVWNIIVYDCMHKLTWMHFKTANFEKFEAYI